MLKIKSQNISLLTYVILFFCLISLSTDLLLTNKIFWGTLFILSFVFSKIHFKFKSIVVGIFALGALYIQLILNQYVLSEEFFLNCLGVLLIIKFSELNNKNNLLSFNLISMIIAVASLIKGQDILSTLNSFLILILLVVNMYLIQQKEILDFSLKNILKYLGFGLSIFPIIIIFYLVFPRAEVNFRLFDTSASSVGIPDSIDLGSFSQFSNSDEEVFTLINNNFKKEDLYFRVKIFDYMEKDQSWRPSSSYYLFSEFKNSLRINGNEDLNKNYQIILEPYKKKWIPSLKNSKLITNDIQITKDYFNQSFVSRELIDRKKKLIFKMNKSEYSLDDPLKSYYTLLPENISPKIKEWVDKNNVSTKEEFIEKIYKRFSDGSYFYNLSPQINSNNKYENFFFNSKEGYCEYYAGMFVLLTRLAQIPSRIVTGYYGGDLNEIGNFFQFKQKDTHAWAEVWFDERGWVRIDPTRAIPNSNIRNSLNNYFVNNDKFSSSIFSNNFFKIINFYFNYVDFVWTQHLLSYDDNERKNFIKELLSLNFSKVIIWIFVPILLFVSIKLLYNFNSTNLMRLKLAFILLGKKRKLQIKNSDTIQEIYLKLMEKDKSKYKNFFKFYEKQIYSNNQISFIKVLKLVF